MHVVFRPDKICSCPKTHGIWPYLKHTCLECDRRMQTRRSDADLGGKDKQSEILRTCRVRSAERPHGEGQRRLSSGFGGVVPDATRQRSVPIAGRPIKAQLRAKKPWGSRPGMAHRQRDLHRGSHLDLDRR
jgi:hypothetical protein